ncbi:Lsr2 family protein [Leifsonia sp. F6_8S_P_1B]|uniref:Lsr2 family protein n=1 Tax=Leifsonia williamsii TaxID=3035919 RepID=A0ABT8K846_9MICO|nr:Lsr2 family protein [Leifsonia williamsii]MDN4613615.1 Lsr2 family protein [Leifsonia williamsii]
MARKVIETILDDIDGSEDASTVFFAFDGRSYEIDLSDENRDRLASALQPFIDAARTTSSLQRSTTGSRPAQQRDLNEIREWARNNGFSVSDRGRVAAHVIEAYDAAN